MTQDIREPDGNDRAGRRWGHLIRRGVPLVILAAALVGGYLYWQRSGHAGGAQAAPAAAGQPMEVQTVVVREQTVPLRPKFLGQTEPSQTVEIRSRVKGFLLERAFEEGQTVKKGQVLFRIDPKPFEAELAMAKAQLASADARRDRAAQQVKRHTELYERQSATLDELEEWRKELRVAEADVQLEQARIRQAELDLGYTTISAPLAGSIGRATKDVGSYVDDAADSQLAVLRQVDPIYVRYSVSEQEILRWQRLQESGTFTKPEVADLELEITLGDDRTYPHRGRINFVDVRVDPQTGTAVVRGTVANPDARLRPGQFVHATVLGIDRVGTVMVPQRAVLQSPAGPSVYVVDAKNVVEQRPVTLGEWQGDQWIIEKGLKPGERVITDRLMQVRPGTSVVAVPAPAAATQAVAEKD